MFASLSAKIRRLPRLGQAIAWPFFGMLWLIYQIIRLFLQILGWMLKEMGGRAKVGAKKTIAPLLWPVAAVLGLVALAAALGPHGIQLLLQQVLAPLLAIGIMLFGFRVMLFGIRPKGKKKKK